MLFLLLFIEVVFEGEGVLYMSHESGGTAQNARYIFFDFMMAARAAARAQRRRCICGLIASDSPPPPTFPSGSRSPACVPRTTIRSVNKGAKRSVNRTRAKKQAICQGIRVGKLFYRGSARPQGCATSYLAGKPQRMISPPGRF
jgi:hypothetical protein